MTATTRRRDLLLTGLAAVLLVPLFAPSPALAAHEPITRLAGADRVETAIEVSKATFPSAEQAVIARKDQFPDALASAYLANWAEGPILLTDRDALSSDTSAELERLGVSKVFIVGGTQAVSAAVATELSTDYEVERLGGDTRYDTMRNIAARPGADNVGTLGTSGRTAIVARADEFADALAGGAIAYNASFPTILTSSTTLSPQASSALDALDIDYVIVLGGTTAINQSVVAQIEAKGINTQRLGGATRTDTAVAIATFARDQLGFTLSTAVVARGDDFPDALAGGTYAGFNEAPILLTRTPSDLSAATRTFLQDNAASIQGVTVLGGTSAVTQATAEDAQAAAA